MLVRRLPVGLLVVAAIVTASCGGAAPRASTSPSPRVTPTPAQSPALEAVSLTPQSCGSAPAAAPVPALRPGEPDILAKVPAGKNPDFVIPALGSLWVFTEEGTLLRLDPVARRVVATIDLGQLPATSQSGQGVGSLTGGPDGLWLEWGTDSSASADNQVVKLDLATNKVIIDQTLPGADQLVDTPNNGLWVVTGSLAGAAGITGELAFKLDPSTGKPIGPGVPVGDGKYHPTGQRQAVYGLGSIWIAEVAEKWLVQFDPASGTVKRVTEEPLVLRELAASDTGLYAGTLDNFEGPRPDNQGLAELDPATGCITRLYGLGPQTGSPDSPVPVATAPTAVYVAYKDSAVARLDLATHTLRALSFKATGDDIDEGLCYENGRVWYSLAVNNIAQLKPDFS